MFGTKQGIRQKVIDAGLECVSVVTGHFLEWQVSPFYKFDFETMTTTIYGDGNTKISFTSLGDIARFTAGSINHPDLQNPGQKQFFVRTAHVHASMNEVSEI